MGLDRRPALWDARRVKQGVLPLFEAAGVDALGAEESSALPIMPASEQVITDYQTTRLSLRGHPMSFLRDKLSAEGVLSCDATNKARNGHIVRTAGVVLIRQRPGKGNAIFITLEDESGVTNLLLWARDFERYRRVVMTSRLILAEGEVQRSPEGVVHLMAKRIEDRTAMLDQLVTQQAASPDEDGSDFAILRTQEGSQGHHPRNVRILPKSRELPQSRNMPKSRDFH
jgi:error-prone DNA polymerase